MAKVRDSVDRRGNLTNCILAALIGRERVKVKEIMPYLYKRIDPARAVRRLLATKEAIRRNYHELPLQDKIELGRRHVLLESIRHLARTYVEYDPRVGGKSSHQREQEPPWEEVELTLNARGLAQRESMAVWKELRHAVQQGYLTVQVGVSNGQSQSRVQSGGGGEKGKKAGKGEGEADSKKVQEEEPVGEATTG